MAGTQITAQQQTTIQQSVLSARNVPRVDNVNFDVHTGVAIPTSVHVVSVSEYPSLIEFFPRYRDDSFFVVEDEIVIVDHSHRIVDVIPAGPRARFSRSSSTTTSVELSEPEIREVQQVLIERGYLHGRVDGVWGPETREALVAFQRKEGIEAHGSVDTRTISALGLSDRIREHGQGVNQSSTSGASERGAQQQPNAAGQQNRGQANTSSPNSSAAGQKPSETGKSSSAQSNEPKGQGGPRDQSTTGQGGRGMEPAQRDKNSPSGSAHETPQRAPAGSTQDQNPRR
jgi:peptidoglycan hydrolase-like protein with peptidoglycan-binding domain